MTPAFKNARGGKDFLRMGQMERMGQMAWGEFHERGMNSQTRAATTSAWPTAIMEMAQNFKPAPLFGPFTILGCA